MLRAIPIAEFIKKLDELAEHCRTSDDPITLTYKNHGDLVVLGSEAYNKLLLKLRFVCDVADANARFIEGDILTDDEIIDKAMEAVHEKIQSRVRLNNVA